LYAVETAADAEIAKAKVDGAAADAVRERYRREQTKALLATFATWLEEQARLVLPKSPIGQAIAYAQRQWSALTRFTETGFLNIDNNASERALRAIAVGRNYARFRAMRTTLLCPIGHALQRGLLRLALFPVYSA
jgi:transposase